MNLINEKKKEAEVMLRKEEILFIYPNKEDVIRKRESDETTALQLYDFLKENLQVNVSMWGDELKGSVVSVTSEDGSSEEDFVDLALKIEKLVEMLAKGEGFLAHAYPSHAKEGLKFSLSLISLETRLVFLHCLACQCDIKEGEGVFLCVKWQFSICEDCGGKLGLKKHKPNRCPFDGSFDMTWAEPMF